MQWIKKWVGDSPDETAFMRWPIKSLLIQAGFEKIQTTPFDWLHPNTPMPFIKLVDSMSRIMERIHILREFAGSLLITARRPSL